MGFCLALMKLPQWSGSPFESSLMTASKKLNCHLSFFNKKKKASALEC